MWGQAFFLASSRPNAGVSASQARTHLSPVKHQLRGGIQSQANEFFGQLSDALSPQSFSISSSSAGDAFEEALAINKFIFDFSKNTGGADAFDLKSARLEIIGVVPLPAAFWLLGGVAAAGLIQVRAAAA